jgi:uncharacterized membrane-anchored protein
MLRWIRKRIPQQPLYGEIKVGRNTKQLLQRLKHNDIAVLFHDDLDEMAALGLIEKRVKAIVNCGITMSGNFPVNGPYLLMKANIPLYEVSKEDIEHFKDGLVAHLFQDRIIVGNQQINTAKFTELDWNLQNKKGYRNMEEQLSRFIDNTVVHAINEKDDFLLPPNIPLLKTNISGKPVVVVTRGKGYQEDLSALRSFIKRASPVLIGVDGGADALLKEGFVPHIIIGDMDSVSDLALRSGAECIVHAYSNGKAPGMDRIVNLKLEASLISVQGTSEDAALLLAYESNAEMIVTVGSHTHMLDFLEKGRKGMASTFLTRMKVGAKLIDAKGLSRLYPRQTAGVFIRQLFSVVYRPRNAIAICLGAAVICFIIMLWRNPLHEPSPVIHSSNQKEDTRAFHNIYHRPGLE